MSQVTDQGELCRPCPSPFLTSSHLHPASPLLTHQRPTPLPDIAGLLQLLSNDTFSEERGHREPNVQALSTEKCTHTHTKQKNVTILVAKTAIIMAKEVWDSVYLSGST